MQARQTISEQVRGEIGKLRKMNWRQVKEMVGEDVGKGGEQRKMVEMMTNVEGLKAAILEKQPDMQF